VRDARASSDLNEDFGQMGFRIPAVAISPFARGGSVRHAQLGFESIIKLISYRFGLGHLTVRDRYATNIGETLNWDSTDLEPPDLPDPEQVASRPCTLGGGDVLTQESAAAHVSDLGELEALADRFGFPVGDGKAADLFTKPDAIRRSLAAA
jgi:phospholipase C